MISTEHVDALFETTTALVKVISKVSGDVGGFAVTLDNHSVAIVAEG